MPDPALSRCPPQAVIVAHGAPTDPAPQEVVLNALAAAVGARLPDWDVRGATMAAEGALEAALAGFAAPLIYPLFMAEGWFTGTALPGRLARAGAVGAHQLAPLGTDPALPALMADMALEGARRAGLAPGETALLLAAHGSQVSQTSAGSTWVLAQRLRALTPFRTIAVGFVEEAPYLATAARGLGPALCLPFFALRAGHVVQDIPEALAEAGFAGPLLPPLSEYAGLPALIAAALRRAL